MGQVALKSKHRSKVGKNTCSKLRRVGRIPAVLYGPSIKPVHLDLEEREVASLVHTHGLNPIISLTIEDSPLESNCLCMLKAVQKDVFQREILHVDLRKVDLNEKVAVNVPLHLEGEEIIRAKGGIVEQLVRTVRVLSLPTNIPDGLSCDIGGLKMGQTVQVGDLPLPAGVELAQEKEVAVVSLSAARGSALFVEAVPT